MTLFHCHGFFNTHTPFAHGIPDSCFVFFPPQLRTRHQVHQPESKKRGRVEEGKKDSEFGPTPGWGCCSASSAMGLACCRGRFDSSVARDFLPRSTFNADSPVHAHALTSVHRSKIPSTDSHPIVWTHKNTAHTRSILKE